MAHEYTATVRWHRGDQTFTDRRYSRVHDMVFDGGAVVKGSPAEANVRQPYSDPAAVDPEEALVAAVSSCHMLFFLDFASREGFCVDYYIDKAVGRMTKNDKGKLFISHIGLRPDIAFSGDKIPDKTEIDALHHRSHEECFIANSILTQVTVEQG